MPTWYRINDQIIDIVGLCQKVAADGGSDFIVYARKADSSTAIVEIRGVRRENYDALTQSELDNFVSVRSDIVDTYRKGKEYRNEPTSSVIIGGMRNSNYTAYPSSYNRDMHLRNTCSSGNFYYEDYGSFPSDITVRLFGGNARVYYEACDGSDVSGVIQSFSVDSGAIFPFWGFTPDDAAYPLAEPFLSLDHFAFDKDTSIHAQLKERIPNCKLAVGNFTVREVVHQDVFLDGDGDSDDRPFALLDDYYIDANPVPSGYMKGLPLNTEILRAAIAGPDQFFNIYWCYYSDISNSLGFPVPSISHIDEYVDAAIIVGNPIDLHNFAIAMTGKTSYAATEEQLALTVTNNKVAKTAIANGVNYLTSNLLYDFSYRIYDLVKQYATDNMGKKWLVALPKSTIMNRIWNNLEVPTNPNKPEIEYIVDQRGYWEYVPPELDGVVNTPGSGSSIFTADQEMQIQRRFMAEDSRFEAMIGIDWYPSGNINFNSNGLNAALFQDLPTSEFRPNRIAEGNPSYILCSCSVNQLIKRPDLALVEIPTAIRFDPPNNPSLQFNYNYGNENIANKLGAIKYLKYLFNFNNTLRGALKKAYEWNVSINAEVGPPVADFQEWVGQIFKSWASGFATILQGGLDREMNTEYVMDLKGVIIPLTSTWVSYGPWYGENSVVNGMVKVDIDPTLVPWNFDRPPTASGWDANLNAAGQEKLTRTISDQYYLDSAVISVAGFPELGPGTAFGYNSNLTSISVDFGIGGVKTTYNFSTYGKKPGTYRKSEYDNVSIARVDLREQLPQTENTNLIHTYTNVGGINRFVY